MEPLVKVERVTFHYGAAPVLEEIDLHLHPGQFAAVVGPSGAGKTTLLKLILGLLSPTKGAVSIAGKPLLRRPTARVGYVPQLEDVDWNFPVTVEQVVLMGLVRRASLWPWPSSADKQQLMEILDRLEIASLARRHIRDLSGGQQQRVFLARALIAEPDLLVLDEPTRGVDMRTAEVMLHMLADLNRQGMTILLSTHDLNAAAAHVPWVICLNRRLIAQGRPENVFTVETLNATYQDTMLVIRQDGLLLVHQRPHSHTYHEVVPNPVPGPEGDHEM